ANLLSCTGQRRQRRALTREADIPLASTAALDSGRLGRTLQRTVQDDLDLPNVHDTQSPGIGIQLAPNRHLWEGDAVVAPLAAKAWITRLLFSRLNTAKECLEGQINADSHVL